MRLCSELWWTAPDHYIWSYCRRTASVEKNGIMQTVLRCVIVQPLCFAEFVFAFAGFSILRYTLELQDCATDRWVPVPLNSTLAGQTVGPLLSRADLYHAIP